MKCRIDACRILAAMNFVVVVLVMSSNNGSAQVINFDAPGGLGGANYSGPGAVSDEGNNYWNPIVQRGTTTAGLLSDGITSTAITLTDTSPSSYNPGQGAQGTPGGLESPFLLENTGSVIAETLSNIPAGTYNLYLYGKNDDGGDADRGTTFTASTSTTPASTRSTVNSVATTFTLGNDYVVFSNLVVGTDGKITFTYTANTAATGTFNPQNEGDFNGLQLVAVAASPAIAVQPISVGVSVGNSTQLAAAAVGSVPLFYQWQKENNGAFVNISDTGDVSGSTTNVLAFSTAMASDSGNYRVIVANAYGSTTSQVATVTVNLSPVLNTQPASISVSLNNPAELTATASGEQPLSYQWQKESNGVFVNSADTGDVSGSLSNILSFGAAALSDSGSYRLIVANAYGSATSQVANVTVLLSPPVIISQPPSETLAAGGSYQLPATATGALPLYYQWQSGSNGVYADTANTGDISGSANSALQFDPVSMSDAGDYRLIVTNDYGAVTSVVANVSVFVPSSDNSIRMGFSYEYVTNYSDWEDSFLAGNGRMGIMVFGNPLDDTVIYNDRGFNLAANTNSSVRTFAQISASDEATIRSECATADYSDADNLAVTSSDWNDGGEGSRHPGYEMLISIPQDGPVSNYSRVCNFRTGEISVNWSDNRGSWTREAFVSRKDNVTVQYLPAPSNGTITCSLQLTTDPGMGFPSGMSFTGLASTNFLNMRVKYPSSAGDAGYEGVTRVIVSGGTESVNGGILNISNANSVILLTRTAKYYNNCENQWNQDLLQGQLALLPTDYNILLNGQLVTHEAIYDRVKLDLNASAADRALPNETLLSTQASNSTIPEKALWERVFDAGRYYFLSSSSSNTPPDLLGMWTGNCSAGWGGFYTLDANLNLQIAGGNIGDMPEAMAGYFAINEGWQRDFETNAAKLLNCRGMVAAGNTPGTNGLISSISTYYPYHYATGEEGWLLYPFWEHYLITGDTNFLLNQLYPLLKDMGYFYQDFLTLTDTNGNYIFAGSVSPENQPSGLGVSLVNNSTFDISGARFALTALIQTCNLLGLDQGPGQGVETWSNILQKLPPYLIGGVTGNGNSVGALQEWDWPGLQDNFDHRHSSQMLTVWPFREITPETTPALFDAAAMTLDQKDQYNYENAGHGWLHSALVAAGLKNAMAVNKKILYLTSQGYYYNSLCSSHYNDHGTYCTDTCNAMPGIMIEMLVSSSPGILELLPALPQDLDQGSITDVKGRNRVTVQNLSWNISSNLVTCTLRSDIDQDITLIERSGIETITTSATVGLSPLGQIARVIHLQAGVSTVIAITLGQFNLALGRPVTVSSGSSSASNAVDGNNGTAWTSAGTQNEWIYVDLGSVYNLTGAQISWGTPYGQSYMIQISNDAVNWTNACGTPDGFGGTDRVTFAASGRYVRLLGVQSSASGYSVSEFQVFGNIAALLPATPANLAATPVSSSQVVLSWTASANATGYNVKQSTTEGGPYTIIATNISTLTYTNIGLSAGTTYYYVVSAVNSYGESDNSPEVNTRLVSTTIPSLGLSVEGNQLLFNWPTDHIGWQLEAQTNPPGVGIGTNWFIIGGSDLTNEILLPVNSRIGGAFFRLIYSAAE